MKRRLQKINSLLREVIAQIIKQELPHRGVEEAVVVQSVETTADLFRAKVYISILVGHEERVVLGKLRKMAGYIGRIASKKVRLRHFPSLEFILDTAVSDYLQMEQILDHDANR